MDFALPATTTAAAAAATTAAPEELPFPRSAAASPPSPPAAAADADSMAEEGPRAPEKWKAGAGGDVDAAAAAAAAAEVEDRMDLLWEDFNEELALARRRARGRGGGSSWRDRGDGLLVLEAGPWSSPSDAGSEPAGRVGCAPVLRPSSRAAGGARHYRRRAGSWVLLVRIFRRLFVIDKTISVARQRSATRAR